MFDGLFEDEDSRQTPRGNSRPTVQGCLPKPAPPRGCTGLCGLSNLGATCYLNSLLQTLYYTPEFREALFSLTERELGVVSEGKSSDNSMVRAIPRQLQHLFARLQLLDQSSASVTALTDSFGWTNNEEFQQHDVQELNRILFSAIESSLLGTSGEQLISKLYHGATVQQITCQVCGRISEREEEFLDIPVALSGHSTLEDTLREAYIKQEALVGPNQYFCERCQKLVDAKRGCHIRKLPSILTFALLRFLYDFKKGERYKDTGKYKFPMVLDMAPYCEAGVVKGHSVYELFSVVIHSGSTHSGHYTAFIRDVDDLGRWTHPEEKPVKLPMDSGTSSGDLMDYENPADILAILLRQLGGSTSISTLCKYLQDQTGVTWNKRFRKQFGPVVKFMKSCADLFAFSDTTHVSIKTQRDPPTPEEPSPLGDPVEGDADSNCSLYEATQKTLTLDRSECSADGTDVKMASPEKPSDEGGRSLQDGGQGEMVDVGGVYRQRVKPIPPAGHCWFEFNDALVSPICSQDIEKMFQGKKSAYMLFYRRQTLRRPANVKVCTDGGVPEQLMMKVASENAKVQEERSAYEVAVNTVKLNLHYHSQYCYDGGALHRNTDTLPVCVSIDKRETMKELKDLISESYPDLMRAIDGVSPVVIHSARFLPAGIHLYDMLSDKDEASLAALDITDESHLFLWDGVQVGREHIPVGEGCEPMQLSITYPTGRGWGEEDEDEEDEEEDEEETEVEMAMSFSKSATLREVRATLAGLLEVQPNLVTISQVKVQERRGKAESSVVVLSSVKDKLTLSQLSLCDGDRLIVEREIKKGVQTLAHSVADKRNKMLSFIVEDRCTPQQDPSMAFPIFPIELARDYSVLILKAEILSKMNVEGDFRFRVETDPSVFGPPLYEHQTLEEGDIDQGKRVVMEPGSPPLDTQIYLQCKATSSTSQIMSDVILEKKMTVGESCVAMAMTLGLTGDCWHLRKTDWCGEEADILEDEMATLEKEKLKPGDVLIVEEGKLPPKGYIRLAISLYTPSSVSPFQQPSMLSEAASSSTSQSTSSSSFVSASSSSQDLAMQEATRGGTTPPTAMESEPCLHLLSPSQFYPCVPGDLLDVGSVEVNRDVTVHDLKLHILTLPAFENAAVVSSGHLRLRELSNGRLSKIFKQSSLTLRRLKLKSGTQLCCQILDREENVPNSAVVVNICMREASRQYGTMKEVIYDLESTPKASSPRSFMSYLSDLLSIPLGSLMAAKHKMEAFQWIPIESSHQVESKGRKRGGAKVSIKNSPIMLRDGDTIGIKDLRFCDETDKDFSTPLDDQGKAVLLAIQEDKRKRRKAKEDYDVFGPKEKRQRRPERGIKIYVPDYRLHNK